ncbi:hypothetical protein [Streptomyces endophytica]|uniref:Uncharacterized protein n=1 Tax=Streptomyces endophytica TaxID=2991496 RepID=A0ABY6PG31_9ACTN|nr:hypothetical protein [Streptomyces endophytica]UZJ32828.1 hypothetical protein OJ254_24260 [Streptomyces endophytica]
MTKMNRTFAALLLAAGASAAVHPAANASQTDQPLLFSVDDELAKLHDLGPHGKVARAATSLTSVFHLLTPVSRVLDKGQR